VKDKKERISCQKIYRDSQENQGEETKTDEEEEKERRKRRGLRGKTELGEDLRMCVMTHTSYFLFFLFFQQPQYPVSSSRGIHSAVVYIKYKINLK
jgi:hypothetical protein